MPCERASLPKKESALANSGKFLCCSLNPETMTNRRDGTGVEDRWGLTVSRAVPKGRIEFSVFTAEYASEAPLARRRAPALLDFANFPRRNKWGSLLCAASILGIHLAIIDTFLGAPAGHAQISAAGGTATSSEDGESMQVVLMETQTEATNPSSPPRVAVIHQTDVTKLLRIISVAKGVLLDDAEPVDKAKVLSDVAGDSVMAGRYLGQINARIERAWARPRTAIGAELFACTVDVEQDSSGNVRSTTLLTCNGNERWQQSLVAAIRAASPLPAPPEPAVFRRNMRLVFQSVAYQEGRSSDGFEPAAVQGVRITDSQPLVPETNRSDAAEAIH